MTKPQALLEELQHWNDLLKADPNNPQLYVRRGMTQFKLSNIPASIQDFDRAEQLDPRLTPYLWQRGLAYYYANRFAEGAQQFEIDLTVNTADVEETVWRYLCMAQLEGAEAAKTALLPVRNDPRAVMRVVYHLFAGTSTPEQVLAAGERQGSQGKFYSQLYVGLYYEAQQFLNQPTINQSTINQQTLELAKHHLNQAVHLFETAYQTNDYMGYLALVHQHQRGWEPVH
jgi:tetratricopeptide (TPR) repeat protein